MSSTSISELESAVGNKVAAVVPQLESYAFIEDVELTISVELDRRVISMEELLRLDVGNVITFSRAAGENIDVFVDDVLLGHAEILVLDDKLAVRMADMRSKPTQR